MRVSMNGKPFRELDPGLERRLAVRKTVEVAQGVVLTPDEAVAQATRGMKLLYGFALSLGAVISLGALGGVAVSEPGDLPLLVATVVVLWTGLGFLVRFVYRRNLVKVRARVDQMTALAEPGAPVRVDGKGLTVGAAVYGWPDLALDEVGVADASSGDGSYMFIERLMLSGGGRSIDLDVLGLKNGQDIVNQTWRRMRTPAA